MKLNKFFKLFMLVLIVVSVGLLIWGFAKGFGGATVDTLLYWTYVMVAIAVACWVILGLIVSAKNNPKSLIKIGVALVGAAVLCLIAYLLAPATPAAGREGLDTVGTLKLTDTILNLTYIIGAASIVAIIVGEIRLASVNKK